jgi:hypothetical protein
VALVRNARSRNSGITSDGMRTPKKLRIAIGPSARARRLMMEWIDV